jgi:hypothetical protein
MKRFAVIALAGTIGLSSLAGCAMTQREQRATVIGAGTGAVIGAVAHRSVGGAVVGGVLGGVAGHAFAKATYPCQKRGIFGRVYTGHCLR